MNKKYIINKTKCHSQVPQTASRLPSQDTAFIQVAPSGYLTNVIELFVEPVFQPIRHRHTFQVQRRFSTPNEK